MTVRILVGDCRSELRALPERSVHACGTSPPYWGLRDYQIEPSVWGGDDTCKHEFLDEVVSGELRLGLGMEELSKAYRGGGKKAGKVEQINAVRGTCLRCGAWRGAFGLEPTPELFIAHAVDVFREVWRVLRDDGTLWLNIGDSYANDGKWGGETGGKQFYLGEANRQRVGRGKRTTNLKPKDLVGIPWMLAFALRADGWWLRQDIIWAKPNPMPESVTDRCTKAHEYLFLLSKSERYFYDADAIAEPASPNTNPRVALGIADPFRERPPGVAPKSAPEDSLVRAKGSWHESTTSVLETRNKRSVWTVSTKPYPEAHFATFPPDLIEPCIKASTSERGCCPACGAGWARVIRPSDRYAAFLGESYHDHANDLMAGMMQHRGVNRQNIMREEAGLVGRETELLGWYPHCRCDELPSLPKHPKRPARDPGPSEHVFAWRCREWLTACRLVDDRRKALCDAAAPTRTVPAVFLDPFGGSGTSALVADRLQRDSIIVEINPEYAEMARRRVFGDAPLFHAAE